MGRLSDLYRTAFVTGAASGLGRAFADMLTAEGVLVWGTARDVGRFGEVQAGLTPVTLDLADRDGALAAYERAAVEAGGAFDLVINNAGYGIFGEFGATSADAWEAQLDAMLGSTLRITHVAWRSMRERNRGALVNVSSLAVDFPLPFMSGYNIAKAGLSALSESLIFESRGSAVMVIDFRPGDYRTGFNRTMQSVSPAVPLSPTAQAAWKALEANLEAAPQPALAALDLRRALLDSRSGTVRSGSFFQASLAPLFARIAPARLMRAVTARFFGSR